MERFTIHSLKHGEELKHINILPENSDWYRYRQYFQPLESHVVFYVYDNEKKQIIGFCTCFTNQDKNHDYIDIKDDELYIAYLKVFNERTVDKNYRDLGFGTKLLKAVENYARKEGFQRLLLDSMNEDTSMFYWERGWVTKSLSNEMIKEIDPDIWLYACVFDECMNNAINTKDKDVYKELIKLIKEKSYDNIFQYLEENDIGNGSNPTMKFFAFDNLVQRKILNSKYVPHIIKELQEIIDTSQPHHELKKYYEGNKLLSGKNQAELNTNKFVRNVMADIYLIEKDKLTYKENSDSLELSNENESLEKK